MATDTKQYALVYKTITEALAKYWTRTPRLYRYDNFRKYLVKMASELHKAAPEVFPKDFYEEMTDTVLLWYWNRLEGLTEDDIVPTFQAVWRLQKKYLPIDFNDDTWTSFTAEMDTVVRDKPKYVGKLLLAVGNEFQRLERLKEAATEQ